MTCFLSFLLHTWYSSDYPRTTEKVLIIFSKNRAFYGRQVAQKRTHYYVRKKFGISHETKTPYQVFNRTRCNRRPARLHDTHNAEAWGARAGIGLSVQDSSLYYYCWMDSFTRCLRRSAKPTLFLGLAGFSKKYFLYLSVSRMILARPPLLRVSETPRIGHVMTCRSRGF